MRLKVIWSVCGQVPVYSEPVELYGEAVFRAKSHTDSEIENILPMTVKDAIVQQRKETHKSAALFWDSIQERYEPAIKVHSYRLVTQIDRLVDCNMRLRVFDKLRNL